MGRLLKTRECPTCGGKMIFRNDLVQSFRYKGKCLELKGLYSRVCCSSLCKHCGSESRSNKQCKYFFHIASVLNTRKKNMELFYQFP